MHLKIDDDKTENRKEYPDNYNDLAEFLFKTAEL